ncbi:uncharacterized protein RHOBADRAFT_41956 [Rhodotorula graminis WP1]|uniref:Uncharacterized protein n=1 Tax=Rhodotorula graminis (strain WP1) TaxID=578459 RepID=A0A194S859_RHOGW|nr:uncharacterized protein RHOBADRAFT_41956 [Rhodotorula graminis WP1]KPV76749.1 hypothetical protein RHOBADRAFT_41956 [Rhodotorula graminis WP1]
MSAPSSSPVIESRTSAPSVTRSAGAAGRRGKEDEEGATSAVQSQGMTDGSSGGLRAVAKATSNIASKLLPFPTRSPRTLGFAHDQPPPPVPHFPLRRSYDMISATASSSRRPSLSFDLSSSSPSSIPSFASATCSTAPFASSSFVDAAVDDDDACTPTASRSHERLPEVCAQTPSQVLWPEYGTKRVERGGRSSSSKLLSLGRKGKVAKKEEEFVPHAWCLVNAITGSFTSDQRIVGSTFVDQDLLILKPRLLAFDPPLHLLHLPYLRLSRIELLTTPLADLAVGPSSPTTPKRSKRRSWGSAPKGGPLFVERVLEIAVEEVGLEGDGQREEGSAPIMVLRVFERNSLEQSFKLPASHIRLVAVDTSLADYFSGDKSPSSRQRPPLSLPIVALDFDADESIAFRPSTGAELDSLLDLLGDEDETSDLLYEGEMERRKNIIDAAYRSHHNLPLPLAAPPSAPLPPPPPSSPVIPLSPTQPISRRRSLHSPTSSRRTGLAKSTTQLVLSRVPSVDEQPQPPSHEHLSSASTSAESLAGGGRVASGFATAPTSPALRPPSTSPTSP